MRGPHLPLGLVALICLLIAGLQSGDFARAQGTAAVAADAWEVRSVPMPDLTRLPKSVQAQVRDRYAFLEQAMARKAPDEQLARAQGDVGLILMATGYYAAAEMSLRNAQALAPNEATWPYYLGQLFLLTNDRDKTLKSFERALALRPTDLPTLVRLGEVYLEEARPDEAERLFVRARDIDPRSAAVLEGMGRVAQARGDQAKAADYLEQALALDPRATRIHYPLAVAYKSLGKADKAETHLRQRGQARPSPYDPLMQAYYWLVDSADAHYNRGVLAMEAGEWAAAAGLFRKGLALEPKSPSLGHALGLALYWMGDREAASRQFQEVLQRSPEDVQTHVSLGILFAEQKRFRDALTHFAAASKHDPARADAHVGQAEMLRNVGDLAASIPHWQRAVGLDPANVNAWIGGANVLVRLERFKEARDWLMAARKAHPADVDLRGIEEKLGAVR